MGIELHTHLGDRAFLGMKAKSSKGKNSLGPMIPNPFVRFVWSLGRIKTKMNCLTNKSSMVQRATIPENVLTGGVSPDMQWHKLIRTWLPAQEAWSPTTLKDKEPQLLPRHSFKNKITINSTFLHNRLFKILSQVGGFQNCHVYLYTRALRPWP